MKRIPMVTGVQTMPVGAKMNFGTAFDECAIAQQLHIQYGSIPQED